jgi:hypothetical protein
MPHYHNPYQLALYLITRWPSNYEEVAYPQIEAFAAEVLAIADPSQFVDNVRRLISEYEVGRIDRRAFAAALDALLHPASSSVPG